MLNLNHHFCTLLQGLCLFEILLNLENKQRTDTKEYQIYLKKFDDLQEGVELTGTVRSVIDFGAFVDIGVHQDGLVHISQLADKFVKHPLDIVSVGDIVDVKVLDVDLARNRIQLSMLI